MTTTTDARTTAPPCPPWCELPADHSGAEDGGWFHTALLLRLDLPDAEHLPKVREPGRVVVTLSQYAGDDGPLEPTVDVDAPESGSIGLTQFLPSEAAQLAQALLAAAAKAQQ